MQNQLLDISLNIALKGNLQEAEQILSLLDIQDPRVAFNLGGYEARKGNHQIGASLMVSGRYLNVFGSPKPNFNIPIWNAEDLNNKTILLASEGGLGDEIINARFIKPLREKGARVIFSCHKKLKPILKHLADETIAHQEVEKVEADYWIPAMSAAIFFNPTDYNQPFLKAKPKELTTTKKKIGLRWAGNPKFEHEQFRKFPTSLMLDLAKNDKYQFYSFQRDNDLVSLPENVINLEKDLKTWKDTLEYLQAMDLVITSCTSIAHASASLGKETWVILPILPYYVWDNKASYYQTVKLFKQKHFQEWYHPFAEVKEKLDVFYKS